MMIFIINNYALDDHNYEVPLRKTKIACKDDNQNHVIKLFNYFIIICEYSVRCLIYETSQKSEDSQPLKKQS